MGHIYGSLLGLVIRSYDHTVKVKINKILSFEISIKFLVYCTSLRDIQEVEHNYR